MKAINYNIVIEKIKEKPSQLAGLEIIEKLDTDNRYSKARVISTGHKIDCLQDGDIIYYDKNNGHGITWDDKMYHVISIGNVVLVE